MVILPLAKHWITRDQKFDILDFCLTVFMFERETLANYCSQSFVVIHENYLIFQEYADFQDFLVNLKITQV